METFNNMASSLVFSVTTIFMSSYYQIWGNAPIYHRENDEYYTEFVKLIENEKHVFISNWIDNVSDNWNLPATFEDYVDAIFKFEEKMFSFKIGQLNRIIDQYNVEYECYYCERMITVPFELPTPSNVLCKCQYEAN